MSKVCPKCDNAYSPTHCYCPYCGNPNENATPFFRPGQEDSHLPSQGYSPYHMGSGGKMKWFKFIIYFQLFASGILNIISALSALLSDGAEYLSFVSDGYSTWYTVFNIATLILGLYAFYVRSRLANFASGAPKLYLGYLSSVSALSLLDVILLSRALSDVPFVKVNHTFTIVTLIVNAVIIVVNWIYFEERKELFTD